MPYIKPYTRNQINPDINTLAMVNILNAGDLNFAFTVIIKDYLDRKGLSYQHINDVIGALEGCKLELYRRTAVPYENTKIEENGDVELLK